MCAARIQDLAASFGGHARTEAVAAFANQVRWLIGAFHRSVSVLCFSACRDSVRASCLFEDRSIGGGLNYVKPLTAVLQQKYKDTLCNVSIWVKTPTSDHRSRDLHQRPVRYLPICCSDPHLERNRNERDLKDE